MSKSELIEKRMKTTPVTLNGVATTLDSLSDDKKYGTNVVMRVGSFPAISFSLPNGNRQGILKSLEACNFPRGEALKFYGYEVSVRSLETQVGVN